MGNDGSRVIDVGRIEDQLANCQLIQKKECPVYGSVSYVQYNGMQFYLGQSSTQSPPHPMSLHYLVEPNLLIISQFTLLQSIVPSSFDNLMQIISGISEMAMNGGDLGIGYGRVAYAGRWGVVGEQKVNWAYQAALQGDITEGVFLSPQLMLSLSQGKHTPKHSIQKSDVFALGVMLVQLIFLEKLGDMFDYENFQVNLKPLLEKLYRIRQQYGSHVYEMFVAMMEIEQQDRIGFAELYEMVEQIKRSKPKLLNSQMTSSNHSKDMQRGNRTPTRAGKQVFGNRSSQRQNNAYANNVSPFRARPMQNKQNQQQTGRTPDKNRARQQSSRSPLRRDLKICTEFERESRNYNTYGYGQNNTRRPLSPISRR